MPTAMTCDELAGLIANETTGRLWAFRLVCFQVLPPSVLLKTRSEEALGSSMPA